MEEKVLWSEDYIGLADEYGIVYQGKVQEFIVPAKVRYLVQPFRCYVVRRKDAPERSISCNLLAMRMFFGKVMRLLSPERWLCYVLKRIDSSPEDRYYTFLPEFREDEEQ